MIFGPSFFGDRNSQAHRTVLGELECVRQQILQHLLQTFRVGDQAAGEMRVRLHFERKLPVLRFVPEGAGNHFEQVGEENFLRFD